MKHNETKKEAGAHLTTKSNAASCLTYVSTADIKMISLWRSK